MYPVILNLARKITMMICQISETHRLKKITGFLTQYAAWMLGCGATCIRLQKNVDRIAAALGTRVEMTIMPRHIHLTIIDLSDAKSATSLIAPAKIPVNFSINTRLSELSWRIADGAIDESSMEAEFEKAIAPRHSSELGLMCLVSLANASFCRLFGGDFVAMAVVAVATFAGFGLKCILLRKKVDIRIIVFVCALASTILGATDMLFSLGNTPAIAIGTSVLYLVPGIPFLNSFSDLIYRHYICAFGRFIDAIVLTCCLSAGLCLGMKLMDTGMFLH